MAKMVDMKNNVGILIVEKLGTIKELLLKDYSEEELYKKCGFKKADGFGKQTEWTIKLENTKYKVALYAKTNGRANTENKYDFPPPVDNVLYFGSCALVATITGEDEPTTLTKEEWEKMYEKLFGGFHDLAATSLEDDNEEDELEDVPAEMKTKDGYLKDDFVVDSDDEDGEYESEEESDLVDESTSEDEEEDVLGEDEIGSELSEEAYSDED
jgi:hypothetical protein